MRSAISTRQVKAHGTDAGAGRFTLRDAVREPVADGREWPLARAYQYCERVARLHYENFPVGSVLIPGRLRKHFYAIYAFARTADDFADEGYDRQYTAEERLSLIREWRDLLQSSASSPASHPVFVALSQTIRQFNLPVQLFEDLLSAFYQDVTTKRYETFEDVIAYCRLSANPIGRLILLLFGLRDEEMHRWSDAICTALQLANHWQDVAIDLDKDRIYIPLSDLRRFGLNESSLLARRADAKFQRLMRLEVERARELFMLGKPLCLAASGRLAFELRAVWLGGWRILELIEQNGYDVFARRPVITSSDKLRILSHAIRKEQFRRY